MSSFQSYFRLGIQHILAIQDYDHVLFILALCAVFIPRDWRKVLVLMAAFAIGHSLTLALATFKLIKVDSYLIEFLITVTIAITAFITILRPRPSSSKGISMNSIFALIFGLIHGLGFSNYLRGILGKEASIWQPLLAFNIGLEVGQLAIVATFLLITSILVGIAGVSRKEWTLVVASMIFGIALMLMLETKFW